MAHALRRPRRRRAGSPSSTDPAIPQLRPPPAIDGDGARGRHLRDARRRARDFWAGTLAALGAPLAALFIDYGHARSGLRRYAASGTRPPLRRPARRARRGRPHGSGRLRSRRRRHARAAALSATAPRRRREFLGALGIAERGSRLMAANPAKAARIEAGYRAPDGAGRHGHALSRARREQPRARAAAGP